LRARDALLRKPWLLPFIAALQLGATSASDAAGVLNVPRRLASTGLYTLRRMGVEDAEGLCILRLGRLYATIVGTVVVVAKVRRRSVKAYTVPLELVERAQPGVGGRLGYRVAVARAILERGERIGACWG